LQTAAGIFDGRGIGMSASDQLLEGATEAEIKVLLAANGNGHREADDPIDQLISVFDGLDEKTPLATVEEKLRSLALLLNGSDPLRRATVREGALRKLEKIGISAPGRLLDAALGNGHLETDHQHQGRPVIFDDPEPWPENIDGASLLDDAVSILRRFVVLPRHAAEAVALWILHAHALEAFSISPLLTINSPTKRAGKTLVLEVVSLLVPRRLFTSNISPSALFRVVDGFTPCLLIDEADTFLRDSDELRGILNASHRKASAYVVRCVGDEHETAFFVTWCPKAVALIGKLPGTLEDRSILISMKRKAPKEDVEMFRADRAALELPDFKRKALRWAADNVDALRKADPKTPSVLNDRAADNWRPLLAIADLAGMAWPDAARAAAEKLSGSVDEGENSAAIQLLADLKTIFEERGDRLPSSMICEALADMENRPWPEWRRGKPITQRQLAKLLSSFDIAPLTIRTASGTPRGYLVGQFTDPFSRYLALRSATPQQTVSTPQEENDFSNDRKFFDPKHPLSVADRKTDLTTQEKSNVLDVLDRNPLFPEGNRPWTQNL
jgi:hypothetical protein